MSLKVKLVTINISACAEYSVELQTHGVNAPQESHIENLSLGKDKHHDGWIQDGLFSTDWKATLRPDFSINHLSNAELWAAFTLNWQGPRAGLWFMTTACLEQRWKQDDISVEPRMREWWISEEFRPHWTNVHLVVYLGWRAYTGGISAMFCSRLSHTHLREKDSPLGFLHTCATWSLCVGFILFLCKSAVIMFWAAAI